MVCVTEADAVCFRTSIDVNPPYLRLSPITIPSQALVLSQP